MPWIADVVLCFLRVAHQHLRDVGLEQSAQACPASAFFKGHMQNSSQSVDKLEDGFFSCGEQPLLQIATSA